MILCIAEVLTSEEVGAVRALLDKGRFDSGARTAGWHARDVKNNEQLSSDSDAARQAAARISAALARNDLLRTAMRPVRTRPILVNRYAAGMTYGAHIDDAIMGDPPIRTDVSLTLFLSDPAEYDGGALVIENTGGEQPYRLPAGAAIAYPATTLHRVEPVTRGERLAAVTWMQSLVRDPSRREMLFDLDMARREIFAVQGKTRAFDLIAKTHANLLRMWAEP